MLRVPGMSWPTFGKTPYTLISGFYSFRNLPVPVTVPHVPIAQNKWVTIKI